MTTTNSNDPCWLTCLQSCGGNILSLGGQILVRSGLFGLADKSFGHKVVSAAAKTRGGKGGGCVSCTSEREMSEEKVAFGWPLLVDPLHSFTRTAARGKKAGE